MKIKIIVATHKPYWMPEDPIYYPLHVGHAGKKDLGIPGDDTSDSISDKNANFCELTGLYWAWKNLPSDALGMAHYRRHFCNPHMKRCRTNILNHKQAEELLQKTNVILPHKRHYVIETNYSQYIHAHHAEDLEETRRILAEKYPSYLEAYDNSMARRSGHRFNMFIMKRELCNQYCQWLFDILFTLEKRLDIRNYSVNDQRVFGFVSERLLDVWLQTNHIDFIEIPYLFMEKQNWIKKIGNFVWRKIRPQ